MSNASPGTGWRLRTAGRQRRGFGVHQPVALKISVPRK
jgi:hypothetical protein